MGFVGVFKYISQDTVYLDECSMDIGKYVSTAIVWVECYINVN